MMIRMVMLVLSCFFIICLIICILFTCSEYFLVFFIVTGILWKIYIWCICQRAGGSYYMWNQLNIDHNAQFPRIFMLIQFIFDSKHFKFSTKTSEGKSRFDKETNLWGDKYRWELVLVGIASIFGRSFSISMLIRQFSGCGRHHHKTVWGAQIWSAVQVKLKAETNENGVLWLQLVWIT